MFKKIVFLLTVISLPFFIQPASASSHAKSLKNLGINEIMFAQSMAPHHQQAIEMSKMALKNSASPEVKNLCSTVQRIVKPRRLRLVSGLDNQLKSLS